MFSYKWEKKISSNVFFCENWKKNILFFKFTFLLKFAYRPCELFSDILIPVPIKHYNCIVFIYRITKTSSTVWTRLLYENSKQNVLFLFFKCTFLLKWSIVGVNSNVFLQRSGVGSCVSAQLTFQRFVTWKQRGATLKIREGGLAKIFYPNFLGARGGGGSTILFCNYFGGSYAISSVSIYALKC